MSQLIDSLVQIDKNWIYGRYDHRNPYDAAVGRAIRACTIIASGQPVVTGEPEEFMLLYLYRDQLALFYSELRRFVMCATQRRPRRRAQFLELISNCEACSPVSFVVCTATSSAGTWTTVHANLLASSNAGKIGREMLAEHRVAVSRNAGLLAFPNWASKGQSAA